MAWHAARGLYYVACHVPRCTARRTLQALDAALCWRTVAHADRLHCRAAQVILGDRPVGITVKRLWAALSLWDKVRLLWTFLCEVTSPSLVPAKAHRQP
jgi:hypothetical protein